MIVGLHVILLRVEDVERELRFYRDAFDLPLEEIPRVEGQLAHLRIPGIAYEGGSTFSGTLEIIAGGKPQPVPEDRIHSPTTPVFQVDDIEESMRRVVAAGGTVVNDPWSSTQRSAFTSQEVYESARRAGRGVQLAYFADPEGHVIGLRRPFEL